MGLFFGEVRRPARIMFRKQAPMSDPVQPTSSQNPQNTAVENQSVGQFGDWEVINEEYACCKGLPEKVSGGFLLGRGLGRAWHAVKEGVSAFFQKLFGTKSKAPTVPSGVEMRPGTNNCGNPSGSVGYSNVKPKGSEVSVAPVPKRNIPVPTQTKPIVVPSGKSASVSVPSFVEKKPTVPQEKLPQSTNSQAVVSKKNSATSSMQATASVKKDTASTASKYELVDVPGNGNCGLYAVLVGTGVLRASEFLPSPHADYGPHPLPNKEQEFFVQQLRSGAVESAKKQLRKEDGSYSEESLKTIRRLEQQHEDLETVDFQYIAQAIGRPIVVSQYQGNVETYRTICDPKETEPTSLFPEDFNNQQLRQENPIRLYFDGGHYQLMQPIKTS